MRLLDSPVVFAFSSLKVQPHKGQVKYLLDRHKIKVLLGGRRSGKSFCLAIEILFYLVVGIQEKKPSKQIIIAPTLDQGKLLLAQVSQFLLQSAWGGLVETEVKSPFPEIRFKDGSLIIVRTGQDSKNLRGHRADRVVCDEAAFMNENLITQVVMPILADCGGQLVLASTPTSKGSLFHRLYQQGQEHHERVRSFHFPTQDNPHLDQTYVQAQRDQLTEVEFRKEYLGEFIDESSLVFKSEHVESCAKGEFSSALPGHSYSVGYDPARHRDRSAVIVVDVTSKPFRIVHLLDLKGLDYTIQMDRVRAVSQAYGNAKIIIDSTAAGAVLFEQMKSNGLWIEGYTFTNQSKSELITNLALHVEKHEILFPPDERLIQEFRSYECRVSSTGTMTFGAPEGSRETDDLITAMALGLYGSSSKGTLQIAWRDNFTMPFVMGAGSKVLNQSQSASKYMTDVNASAENAIVYAADGFPEDSWQDYHW